MFSFCRAELLRLNDKNTPEKRCQNQTLELSLTTLRQPIFILFLFHISQPGMIVYIQNTIVIHGFIINL